MSNNVYPCTNYVYFDENLATRKESKNSFIVSAVQKELKNRIEKSSGR